MRRPTQKLNDTQLAFDRCDFVTSLRVASLLRYVVTLVLRCCVTSVFRYAVTLLLRHFVTSSLLHRGIVPSPLGDAAIWRERVWRTGKGQRGLFRNLPSPYLSACLFETRTPPLPFQIPRNLPPIDPFRPALGTLPSLIFFQRGKGGHNLLAPLTCCI